MRGTLGDHVHNRFGVKPGFHGEMQRFGEALHNARDTNLVHHFGKLACARRAQQLHGLRVSLHHRLGFIERCLVTTAHHGQHAVHGPRFTARDRCINERETCFLCRDRHGARAIGRGCGVVNKNGAFLHGCKSTLFAHTDFSDILVRAHTGKNDVRVCGGTGRGWRGIKLARRVISVGFQPFFGFR